MTSLFKVKEIKKDILLSFILTSILFFIYLKTKIVIDTDIYNILINSTITMIGFVMTVLAIIITFPSNYKIRFIKKSNLYPQLYNVYFLTILILSIILILGFVGKIFNPLSHIYSFALLFFLVFLGFMIYRCLWILRKLINILHS